MSITKNNLISIFVQLLIGIGVLFLDIHNIQVKFLLVLLDYFYLFFRYVRKGLFTHTIYWFFLLSLFTFLMGGFLLNLFNDEYYTLFSMNAYAHIAISLFLSIFFSSIAYDLTYENLKTVDISNENKEEDNDKLLRVRKASLWVFYGLSLFSIITNAEKAIFVRTNSYMSYYTDYVSRLPSVFLNLASISEVGFFVYLATMPSKQHCRIPMIWYLAISAMSLGFGQRNGFVMSLIFIIIYITIRHKKDQEKWITRKGIIICLVAVPFFIAALYSFNYTRSNRNVKVTGIDKQIVAFFDEQSYSSRIIGYGYEFKDEIKKNGVNYSVSQLANIVLQNTFVRSLFGTRTLYGRTAENALYGNNFGNAITYKVMPMNYLAGIGMGTSYIAEAYHDFGYLGIVLSNILYGILIAIFQRRKNTIAENKAHPYFTALLFMSLINVLYAPRSIVFGFISLTFTFTTLVSICLIQILSRVGKITNQ